jgi:hypothetical protein
MFYTSLLQFGQYLAIYILSLFHLKFKQQGTDSQTLMVPLHAFILPNIDNPMKAYIR